MQVATIARDGLKHAFAVILPGAALRAEVDARLAEIGATVAMPGFSAGKAPPSMVRDRYGAAVLAEVLERAVAAVVPRVLQDHGLRPAEPPRIEVAPFAPEGDLTIRMALEALPEIALPDLSELTLDRLAAEPDEAAVDAALAALAERAGTLEDAGARAARRGEVLQCRIEGHLPADLLVNGPGLGARAGRPGQAPTRWGLDVSPGLEREIPFAGDDGAMPCFDLAVRGTAGRGGFIRVFPGAAAGIPATPGEVLSLRMRACLAAGVLPDGATVRLGFNERSELAILKASRAAVPLDGEECAATITLAADPSLKVVRPLLEIGLPEGAAVDLVLRIGPARVFRGASEPEVPPFEGGEAREAGIEVGGEALHPALAARIDGMAPGERREIDLVFPAGHARRELAGQRARFVVEARAVQVRRAPALDDGFAAMLGSPDLAALREAVRAGLRQDHARWAQRRLRRAVLDALAERAGFAVPECLVAAEFAEIWQRLQAAMREGRSDAADAGLDEAALRLRYHALAERRVRLRLLLSEIGRAHGIEVPQEEMARAIRREAARHPGQEAQVIGFYRRDAEAAAALRGPLLEDRVVEFVVAQARVSERVATREELLAPA